MSGIAENAGNFAFLLSVMAVALAGIVRGFAGFGSAMIMMPCLSAIHQPAVAVPVGLALEVLLTVPFVPAAAPSVDWRRLSLLTATAALAVPFGVLALTAVPAIHLRWGISVVVLTFVAVLAFGWRYRGRPAFGATAAAGAISGLLNGSVGMAGPPVVFYLLVGPDKASEVRATCIVYFGLIDAITVLALVFSGAMSGDVLLIAALLTPGYLAAAWVGARLFRQTNDGRYRQIALVVLSLAAIGSLVP